jgi:colicin import membrane protein
MTMSARRLKVFQAHLGFYDTIVAAPSQKAALEAWGAGRDEFVKGFAHVTSDPAAVKAALAHPGQMLRRPFGSKEEYALDAAPVPAPKLSAGQRKSAAKAEKQKKRRDAAAWEKAERELMEAQHDEIRLMKELKLRETELGKEKAALLEKARIRIARAKVHLAGAGR